MCILHYHVTKSNGNVTQAIEHEEIEVEADGVVHLQICVECVYLC